MASQTGEGIPSRRPVVRSSIAEPTKVVAEKRSNIPTFKRIPNLNSLVILSDIHSPPKANATYSFPGAVPGLPPPPAAMTTYWVPSTEYVAGVA